MHKAMKQRAHFALTSAHQEAFQNTYMEYLLSINI